jgi:hypothetical protein
MHITYDIKNGVEYAKLCQSIRHGQKVDKTSVNLGRVIDKGKGIYKNRERGVFIYDLKEDAYKKLDADYLLPDRPYLQEKLILDFGDIYFLDEYLRKEEFVACIDAIGYRNPDTLYAMLSYYILCSTANCYAGDWWEGSYARILYPKANLVSQRISDFLADIGEEGRLRAFFSQYVRYVAKGTSQGTNVLIDSTGLPNSIRFPLTAISNHNGEINNEVRLIYVTQQETGLPIYFRYCPGNVIDVTTLTRTIWELKENGVNTKFAILDAGYYSEENIATLYENNVSFVSRLKENLKLYKHLLETHLPNIETKENFVSYNNRYAYIKCVECELVAGFKAYAFIGLDIDRKSSESRKLFQKAKGEKLSDANVYDRISTQGAFILVSSRRIAKDKILPTYYTRQQIEQIFDIGKNYADLLPLRVQNEDTFRGHLLMTFIACVIVKKLQDELASTVFNPISLFMNLKNQKCKVYSDSVIVQESFKKANDIYKHFKIRCPIHISLASECR